MSLKPGQSIPAPSAQAYVEKLHNEGFHRVMLRTYRGQQPPEEVLMLSFWRKPGSNTRMLLDDGEACAVWERKE